MKPNNIVEWKETGPGIWTHMPDGEMSPAKRPARKISLLMANHLLPGKNRSASQHRILPMLLTAVRV